MSIDKRKKKEINCFDEKKNWREKYKSRKNIRTHSTGNTERKTTVTTTKVYHHYKCATHLENSQNKFSIRKCRHSLS